MKITDTIRSMISVTPVETISMYTKISFIRLLIRSSALVYLNTLNVNVMASQMTKTT
jgi:hypothetical protein